jgi:flagellar biosynthesis protein FlhF
MKIKKYTGKSLKEVTELMRSELGDDAIILHTKNIVNEGGSGEMYEITAAADEGTPIDFNPNRLSPKSAKYNADPIENLKQIAAKFERSRETKKSQATSDLKDINGLYDIRSEFDTVKGALGEISQQLKTGKIPTLPKNLQTAYENMIKNEIDPKLASDIILEIFEGLSANQLENNVLIDDLVVSKIAEQIVTAEPFKENQKQSKVIVFIGPTGVGKTTTICKIAAVCKYFNRYNVSIISADTYRIAAIDQLRTFTNIANISLDIAYSPEELKDLVILHKDRDVIFIDTVGRSPRQKDQLKDLERYINEISPDEVHLILSATTNLTNLKDSLKQFGILKPNRLIFSKIDESVHLGSLLNIIHHSKIPLSYVTNGQSIPDDIAVAEPIRLASMIYKLSPDDY